MKSTFVKVKDNDNTLYINVDNINAVNKERGIVYIAGGDVLFISPDAITELIKCIELIER